MRSLFLLSLLLISASAEARFRMDESGARPVEESRPARSENRRPAEKKADGETIVLEYLSNKFSVPQKQIRDYRRRKNGYEEIVPALVIAREAQVPADRILEMRSEGKTWASIAGAFEIDLKPLNREVLDILEPIRRAVPEKALTERPEPVKAAR